MKESIDRGIIKKDCFCEHYLHESTHYPRPGLIEKKLSAGDEVKILRKWQNFYGNYYTVEKDGIGYDINVDNLEFVKYL